MGERAWAARNKKWVPTTPRYLRSDLDSTKEPFSDEAVNALRQAREVREAIFISPITAWEIDF